MILKALFQFQKALKLVQFWHIKQRRAQLLDSLAVKKYPQKNVLIIDAGTCITFDFVSDKKEYFGGAISPGIEMRYKALSTFTSKLPLLDKKLPRDFLGINTEESINSGVVNGVLQEIEGVINQYKSKYGLLTIVLTVVQFTSQFL